MSVHKSEKAARKEAREIIRGMNSPRDWNPSFAVFRSNHGPEYDGFAPSISTKAELPRVIVTMGQTGRFWVASSSDTAGLLEDDSDTAPGDTPQQAVNNMLRLYRDRILEMLEQSTNLNNRLSKAEGKG